MKATFAAAPGSGLMLFRSVRAGCRVRRVFVVVDEWGRCLYISSSIFAPFVSSDLRLPSLSPKLRRIPKQQHHRRACIPQQRPTGRLRPRTLDYLTSRQRNNETTKQRSNEAPRDFTKSIRTVCCALYEQSPVCAVNSGSVLSREHTTMPRTVI